MTKRSFSSVLKSLCALWLLGPVDLFPKTVDGAEVLLTNAEVAVRYVEYEFAVERDGRGVPQLNWQRFSAQPRTIVTRVRPAVVLENEYFRATVLPQQGRLHSFVHKPSGREQLWINPVAVPLRANNDTGFWMTWGGMEWVLPRREHGTTHALNWQHRLVGDSNHHNGVCMSCEEPLTGLRLELALLIQADRPYLETQVRVTNRSTGAVRFSHWTTALLAPGGRGEVTPRTELIVPAERFVPDHRDFNAWMADLVGPTHLSPLRFVSNWRSIGDLMASPLKRPYYAVYSHEEDTGIIHMFDSQTTPGFDIWSWGYPPAVDLQRQFTAAEGGNKGYVEFWNGTARGFRDEDLGLLGSGEVIGWTERTMSIGGLLPRGDLRGQVKRLADSVMRVPDLPAPDVSQP